MSNNIAGCEVTFDCDNMWERPEYGRPIWQDPMIKKFIKERLEMDRSGGVFIPEHVQEQLSEYEMKMLQMPWETPKYNLNKRVLIL